MSATNFLELKILDLFFGSIPYTPPAIVYVGISVSDPGETGSLAGEPVIGTGGYARVAVANNSTNFPSASPKVNGVSIVFPSSMGAWAAGANLTHFFLSDAASAGNMLVSGSITSSPAKKVDGTGVTISFSPGGLQVSAD